MGGTNIYIFLNQLLDGIQLMPGRGRESIRERLRKEVSSRHQALAHDFEFRMFMIVVRSNDVIPFPRQG